VPVSFQLLTNFAITTAMDALEGKVPAHVLHRPQPAPALFFSAGTGFTTPDGKRSWARAFVQQNLPNGPGPLPGGASPGSVVGSIGALSGSPPSGPVAGVVHRNTGDMRDNGRVRVCTRLWAEAGREAQLARAHRLGRAAVASNIASPANANGSQNAHAGAADRGRLTPQSQDA